jgi:hypothetical protein
VSAPSLLQDTTFSWLRERLPVRSHLRPQPWRLQPADCALLFDSRSWHEDPELPFIVRDVDLDTARAVAWEGEA